MLAIYILLCLQNNKELAARNRLKMHLLTIQGMLLALIVSFNGMTPHSKAAMGIAHHGIGWHKLNFMAIGATESTLNPSHPWYQTVKPPPGGNIFKYCYQILE